MYTYLPIHLSIYLSICILVYLNAYLPLYLSISVHQVTFVYFSLCIYLHVYISTFENNTYPIIYFCIPIYPPVSLFLFTFPSPLSTYIQLSSILNFIQSSVYLSAKLYILWRVDNCGLCASNKSIMAHMSII